MQKISIVKGEDRKANINKALELISKEIEESIAAKKTKTLFIKINAIDPNFPLACTHQDALEAVLDFFHTKFDEIIVGDNTFVFTKNDGGLYNDIVKKFPNTRISDLSEFESEDIDFKQLRGPNKTGKITLLHKNAYTISLALPKTHDTFVYTGCLKNMFGCVTKNRGDLHAMTLFSRLSLKKCRQSNEIKWQNLVKVINKTIPDLSVLDAFVAMEGNGPLFGTKVHMGLVFSSTDSIALDQLASKVCGIDYVPYLSKLASKEDVKIIKEGFDELNEISKKLELHYNHKHHITTNTHKELLFWDLQLLISILKRSYRIKDKILERLFST